MSRMARGVAAIVALAWCVWPTLAVAEPISIAIATAIAAGFSGATGVILTAGAFGALTTAVSIGIAVGLSIAVSAASTLLTKKKPQDLSGSSYPTPSPQDVQQTIRQSVAARRRHYGRVKSGGLLAFYQSKNGKLYAVILVAQGEIADYEEFWLNDKPVTLDGSHFVIEDQYQYGGTSRVQILTKPGTDAQTAHATLITDFPESVGVPGWTSDHRLRGIANVLVIYQDVPNSAFSGMYPQGPPTYRTVMAAAKVFDPRDVDQDSSDATTWEWSDNLALLVLDHLTHADGMGRARSMFDETSFAAAADICDEAIPLKAGGTEKRYRGACSYDLIENPADVQQRLWAACDGEVYQLANGTYGFRVGKWVAPTVTIENSAVLSYQMEQGSNALSAFNRLKLIYTSPDHDYQETEAEAWEDAANIADTGETKNEELRLLCCPSPSQARRLGKITMARENPRWRGTVRVQFGPGLRALGERTITLQLAEMEIDETFALQKFDMASDLSYIEMQVASLSSDAYDWDAATEEGTAPVIPDDIPATPAVPVPTGFNVIAGSISIGGVAGPVMTATWDVPTRETMLHEINYRKVSTTDWLSQVFDAGVTSWISTILEDGASYEVRLRARTVSGRASDWTATQTKVAQADAVAPGLPTALSSSKAGSNVTVTWTNPNSPNLFKAEVYRNTVNTFGTATLIATLYGGINSARSYADNGLANGTYYWWVRSVNASGVASTEVGSTTQTIP